MSEIFCVAVCNASYSSPYHTIHATRARRISWAGLGDIAGEAAGDIWRQVLKAVLKKFPEAALKFESPFCRPLSCCSHSAMERAKIEELIEAGTLLAC